MHQASVHNTTMIVLPKQTHDMFMHRAPVHKTGMMCMHQALAHKTCPQQHSDIRMHQASVHTPTMILLPKQNQVNIYAQSLSA